MVCYIKIVLYSIVFSYSLVTVWPSLTAEKTSIAHLKEPLCPKQNRSSKKNRKQEFFTQTSRAKEIPHLFLAGTSNTRKERRFTQKSIIGADNRSRRSSFFEKAKAARSFRHTQRWAIISGKTNIVYRKENNFQKASLLARAPMIWHIPLFAWRSTDRQHQRDFDAVKRRFLNTPKKTQGL